MQKGSQTIFVSPAKDENIKHTPLALAVGRISLF